MRRGLWPLRRLSLVSKKRDFEMILRQYQPTDCKELAELFYNTVHTVNAKDYTKEQLDVWATGQVDLKKWNRSLQEHFSIVAVDIITISLTFGIHLGGCFFVFWQCFPCCLTVRASDAAIFPVAVYSATRKVIWAFCPDYAILVKYSHLLAYMAYFLLTELLLASSCSFHPPK